MIALVPQKKIGQNKSLHLFVFAIAMLSFAINGVKARAASMVPTEYRIAQGFSQFHEVKQYAMTFKFRPPRRLRGKRLELAVGSISTPEENRAYVSLRPVWRWPIRRQSFFELGLSPTLIGGSSFNGQDLGGNLHFTSSAAIGATFGPFDVFSMSLRIQHTSNGGLRNMVST